jgi:hypothetical protein
MMFRLAQLLGGLGLLLCSGLLISAPSVGQEPDTLEEIANTAAESDSVATGETASQILRWQLPPEVPLRVTLQQTTDTITTVAQQTLRMRVEISATFDWLVEDVSDSGEMLIRQTFTSLRMRLVPADSSEPVLYDSAAREPLRGAAGDMASGVSPLVGTEVMFSLSPRGEMKIEEIPESTAEIYRQLEASGASESRLSRKTLEALIDQSLIRFPEEPVASGDMWRKEVELAHPLGVLVQTSEFTYRGSLADSERSEIQLPGLREIDVTGRLTFSSSDGDSRSSVSLRAQELTGRMTWDSVLGGIVRGTLEQRLVTESRFQDELITVRLRSSTTWHLERN